MTKYQSSRNRESYDVAVVGSGAGGGMAAKVLTEAGAEVVLLEAGPMFDTAKESKMMAWPYDSPRRGAKTRDRDFGEFVPTFGGWSLEGEPYTQAPGTRFDWFRSRVLGGRTNHWGRISLAISPSGEMAVAVEASRVARGILGTLALMPISGAAPRPILENVRSADWPREGGDLAVLHVVDGRSRIEFPVGNILYETAALISHLRASPRGDWIAFAESERWAESIIVVNRSGQRKVLSQGWSVVLGLCWSPRGDEVWFMGTKAGVYGSTFGVSLDGRERLVAWGMEVEDVSPDGRALFIRRSAHKGIAFLSSDGSEERDLSWLDWSTVADISRDGQTLLFGEEGEGGGPGGALYLRGTDGAPAVRLGKGGAQALSPDGAFALAIRREGVRWEVVVLPTGVGEEEILTAGEAPYMAADWFPDDRRVVLVIADRRSGERSWVLERGSGAIRPITPEGVSGTHVMPDGQWLLAARRGEKPLLYPVAEGEPRSLPGIEIEDMPVEWSEDGRFLYVRRDSREYPYKVSLYRLNVATGERALVREYVPEDVRVSEVLPLVMTPDARFLAYTYARMQLDLYLAEGLK